ncbi:hypothetical protein ACFWXA_30745 [Streptomyces atroolivaceus]|uniref:hypothetical protein n=1 Tax=Streptomyces atroolivaceus TaxID=66869 RepID=UPI003651F63E
MDHSHDDLPNSPHTVTLCAVDGERWAHLTLPVSSWDGGGEQLREWHRGIVRQRADLAPDAPVAVLRPET